MNKQIKSKWLKALRSGKYKQIQGFLTDSTDDGEKGYCCLGVLRDVITPGSRAQHEEMDWLCKRHSKLSGLDEETQRKLTAMNDGAGAWAGKPQPFTKIADFIEKNL